MENISPVRIYDDAQETVINQYLLPHYFNVAFKNTKFITDQQQQCRGVDFTCEIIAGCDNRVDAKAQSSPKYINNPTPTFAFEASTFNRYGRQEFIGWFLHPDNITEYYACVWVHDAVTNEDGYIESPDDIACLEVMMIHKEKFRDYILSVLRQHGINDIDKVVQEMRANNEQRREVCHGIHFTYSGHLKERPVNIVVHKSILARFTIPGKYGHCYVTADRVSCNKRCA